MQLKPVLFIDLDGTVRISKRGDTFIKEPSDIILTQGIEDTLWDYKNKGYLIISISNQGGVAHGHKSFFDVMKEEHATTSLFKVNPFTRMYYCFHMEGGTVEPFCHRSLCRKPDIGMLVKAENDLLEFDTLIDWNNSLFVGDRPEDEGCAKNAGIRFIHIDDFK